MAKKTKTKAKTRTYYALHPWQVKQESDQAEVHAYVEASGAWEKIATIHPTPGASADTLAAYIIGIVNAHHQSHDLLNAALNALEAIVDEGLTYSTEQDADTVIERIKKSG